MSRRVGVFGGTFNPIHEGHLDLARTCLSALDLDEVRLLPSRIPPHKPAPGVSGYHRHAMVALALVDQPGLVADPMELERGGRSFTVETLELLAEAEDGPDLFFLTGMDSLRELRTWRRWEEILERACFVACDREDLDAEGILEAWSEQLESGSVRHLSHRPPPWSSSEIRRRIGANEELEGALHPAVSDYIARHRLYRPVRAEESSS